MLGNRSPQVRDIWFMAKICLIRGDIIEGLRGDKPMQVVGSDNELVPTV